MKLQLALDRYTKSPGSKKFGDLQRCIYFPHGNLFETEATMKFTELMGPFERESKGGTWSDEEKLYASITKPSNYVVSGEPKSDGINSKKTEDYHHYWQLSARPDGYYDSTHVVEIKCPFGQLYKEYGSGKTGTGWDNEKEVFIIPARYKIQMFIEMLCHNRQHGYFMQYYQPKGWYNFANYLINLYKREYQLTDVVYKPFYRHDDVALTLLYRPIRKFPDKKKQLLEFYDKYMNPTRRNTDPSLATKYERENNIMMIPVGVGAPFLPENQSVSAKLYFEKYAERVKCFLRRLFEEGGGDYTWAHQPLWTIFQNEFGTDAHAIRQSFFGGSNILRGTVHGRVVDGSNTTLTILWSNGISEKMPADLCRKNIMSVLQLISGMTRRKDNTDWWKWTRSIQQGVIQSMPTDVPYAEAVVHVLDLSDEWDACNKYMTTFLDILEVVKLTGYTGEMAIHMEKMYEFFDGLESEVCVRKTYEGINI
jgi:hypothetical protein